MPVPLSKDLEANRKTVTKWRKRAIDEDMETGPTEPRPAVMAEARGVAFRRHTTLPREDCFYALQLSIPQPRHCPGKGSKPPKGPVR